MNSHVVPPLPTSQGTLPEALRLLATLPGGRDALIRALIAIEPGLQDGSRLNVRERVTGPIVDAMFEHGEVVEKAISNGLVYRCGYTSKIVRDFVMAADPVPDHVWEPMTTRLVLDLTGGKRTVVIGGAFIGDHALPIARGLAPGGLVHAFELSSANAGFLRANCLANAIANIVINEVGLWSAADVRLALSGEDSHASPYVIGDASVTDGFPATSIDDYAARAGIDAIDLVLLDIEGGELEALRGATGNLAMPAGKAPHVIYEVHKSYVDWSNGLHKSELVRFMTGLGYTSFALRDYNSNVPMAAFPIELVELEGLYLEGPPHGFNLVAVKDPAIFDRPGYRIRRGVSPKLIQHGDPRFHAPIAD